MLHRPARRPARRTALLASGVLLAAPLLASCGFEYQTDQINTISAGVNDRDGQVDVLGAVVIAGEPDVGLFVANLVNNSTTDGDAFQGLQDTEQVQALETTGTAVEVPASGQANLFDAGGIAVTGSFGAGDFVEVSLTFENGQVSTLDVPVVTPCHQYDPAELGLVLPEAPAGATEAEAVETEAAEDTESEDEGLPGPYSCDVAPPVEHHGDE